MTCVLIPDFLYFNCLTLKHVQNLSKPHCKLKLLTVSTVYGYGEHHMRLGQYIGFLTPQSLSECLSEGLDDHGQKTR